MRTPPRVIFHQGTFRVSQSSPDMMIRRESFGLNIVGMGHLFWIAVEESTIIGLVAIGRNAPNLMAILHLQVSELHKNSEIGSALIKAVIAGHPVCEFVVIPFEGTEEFCARLRFIKAERGKMRRPTRVKG